MCGADVESESKAGYDSLDETEGLGACDDGANGKTGSSGNIRRRGSVHFVPRHVGGTEASWLCYVSDDIDKTFRACALRTVVVRKVAYFIYFIYGFYGLIPVSLRICRRHCKGWLVLSFLAPHLHILVLTLSAYASNDGLTWEGKLRA